MAEIAVSSALAVLLHFLPIHNPQKINIKSMQSWLSSMKAYMEDNCGHEGSRMQKDLMNKVRDLAYDIEDVLDEYVLHTSSSTSHNHKITRTIRQNVHELGHGFPLIRINKKMEEINRGIESLKEKIAVLPVRDSNLPSKSSVTQPLTVSTSLLLDNEIMVGYRKPKEEFMRQLVDGEKRLLMLAVKGPGGSGKTTFAKNVFWDQQTRRHFKCHAWVRVSRSCDVDQLLIDILKQLRGWRSFLLGDGSSSIMSARKYLARKRYIVALDDVWEKEQLDYIKNALPDASRGSRIIITTRSSNLANSCASSSEHVHSLEKLDLQDGLNLFYRKAFPNSNGECPSDLKHSSEKIVNRCQGRPLAIVAVAGVLANKPRLPHVWERFHDSLGDELSSNSDLSVISNALLPSYMDLPTNLKCCFLYFSIFPEKYSVKRGRLIRLWVAEGFVEKTAYKTAEEVAEEYLNQLIQRSLVHVSDRDFDGRPRNCRVESLNLEFIIRKCKDENFASIFSKGNTSQNSRNRRVSVHQDYTHLHGETDFSGVRSMFLLSEPPPGVEKYLCKRELLRVLDVQGSHLREFPKGITRLTLLKYLSFRDTQIKTIPSSIKHLSSLETLDLKETDVTELPKEISSLKNLCHLFVYKTADSVQGGKFDSVQGAKVHQGIDSLTKLQELTLVKLPRKGGGILQDMRKLTLLTKLGLMGLKPEHGKDLCSAIELMKNLTTLDLKAATKEEFLEVGEITNPPRNLQRLYLKGHLREFPSWISSLDNLLRIRLMWSNMERIPLQALERLPHLMELHLLDCSTEEELLFEASGFVELKRLEIESITRLSTIVIRNGAMPQIKQLSIRRCAQLMTCPPGLQYLNNLLQLTLCDMPEELIAGLRNNGPHRKWVQHIPVIHSSTLNRPSENLNSASFSN